MIPGPMELVIILIIVAMLFGVGKLPEIFGAVGKGLREFRQEVAPPSESASTPTTPPVEKPAADATPPEITSTGIPSNGTENKEHSL